MILSIRNGKTNLNPRRAKGLAQTSKADAEPGGADYRRAEGNVHQLGVRSQQTTASGQRGDAEKDQVTMNSKQKHILRFVAVLLGIAFLIAIGIFMPAVFGIMALSVLTAAMVIAVFLSLWIMTK